MTIHRSFSIFTLSGGTVDVHLIDFAAVSGVKSDTRIVSVLDPMDTADDCLPLSYTQGFRPMEPFCDLATAERCVGRLVAACGDGADMREEGWSSVVFDDLVEGARQAA